MSVSKASDRYTVPARSPVHIAALTAFALGCSFAAFPTVAQSVNWLDPLSYPKPRPISVAEPNESSVANKYWVDLSGGSGSNCSQASPCALSAVSGKPGTTGGPAYIYVKGTGAIGSPTLYGSSGNEVVIKPWDSSTVATITGRNNWTTQHQHVIWDGGPNLGIKFLNSSGGQFDPSVYFNAPTAGLHSHITFYRTQWQVTNQGEWISQWGIFDNLSFINSEFYATKAGDATNQHHIYLSGASNYGPSSNFSLLGNVIRDTPGEGLELRLFQNLNGLIIDGNAIHNLGKGTCSSSWQCRSAITLATNTGSLSNARITNNLIWDTGEGIVRNWAGNPLIANNTVYDWGMGTPANAGWGQWAFFGYSNDGNATIQNNIILATGATANGYAKIPFDKSPFVASNNLCASGTACGSASGIAAAAMFLSTDQSSTSFLKPAASMTTLVGVNVSLGLDYLGNTRPALGAVGAIQASGTTVATTSPPVPLPPTNVTAH
jgi:hypothetical protein